MSALLRVGVQGGSASGYATDKRLSGQLRIQLYRVTKVRVGG